MRMFKYISSFFLLITLGISPNAFAEYTLNMTKGVTAISREIYQLHMTVLWVCVVIGIVVFSLMIYALIMHRKSRGAKPAQFHEHTLVEIIWAVIPLLILIALAVPATRVLMLMDDTTEADINIKITGYQWKWHYDYLDEGIGFFSNLSTPLTQIKNQETKSPHYLLEVDHPLVVPINKKIRFYITSNDVIHSWWMPAFGVKRDAVPGFIHEAWAKVDEAGTYRGQCAELCGINHGFMPIVVEAKSAEDYQQWIAKQKAEKAQQGAAANKTWTKDELMKKGEQEYLTYCSACHQPTGAGLPPTFPALKGSPIATGDVKKHIDTVLHGVKGTAMQAFGDQLSDTDLAAIITYERNAWGNDKGDVIQPTDITAIKSGKPLPAPGAALTTTAQTSSAVSTEPSSAVSSVTAEEKQAQAEAEEKPGTVVTSLDTNKDYDYDDLMKIGQEVYLKTCAVCHKADGSGMPPTFPALSQSAIVQGPIDKHLAIVLNGVKGTAMQAFAQQLTPVEIAAVVTYERNAWKDQAEKEVVQPKDIEQKKNEAIKGNAHE